MTDVRGLTSDGTCRQISGYFNKLKSTYNLQVRGFGQPHPLAARSKMHTVEIISQLALLQNCNNGQATQVEQVIES
jgi:hypothetical protein